MDNGVSPQSMWKPAKMEEAGSVSSTSTGGFCISLQNHDCECLTALCTYVHVASLILETQTSVHRHSHALCNVYIKSYWTPSRATVTHEDSETEPMISGWAPFQTYLLPGPGWNGSTWISQVKAGIAQWEPKHKSQDTANLMVCTDPKEKWRKKALTSLTQWLPSCKAPEFQGKYCSQV